MPLIYAFPPELRPTVDDVAALEGTRTVAIAGAESPLFSATTSPTDLEVGALIDQAMGPILSQLPATFDERFYDTVKHMVVLYAAILLEGSYHRDKVTDGAVALWHQLLTDGMTVLRKDTGTADGPGRQFGSVTIARVAQPACAPLSGDPFVFPFPC